jgi:hypothetical protein
MLSRQLVAGIGFLTISCIVIPPVVDCGLLLTNFNFVFWNGRLLPSGVLILIAGLIGSFMPAADAMAEKDGRSLYPSYKNYNHKTVSQLVTTYLAMTGAILVFCSLMLYYREKAIVNSLQYDCGAGSSVELLNAYKILRELRATPECAVKWSVKECEIEGQVAVDKLPQRYPNFLEALESNYHCSGFCDTQHTAMIQKVRIIKKIIRKKIIKRIKRIVKRKGWKKFPWMQNGFHGFGGFNPGAPGFHPALTETNSSLDADLGEGEDSDADAAEDNVPDKEPKSETTKTTVKETQQVKPFQYVPIALFSRAQYSISCDGAAARHLQAEAVTVAKGWWWTAVGLFSMAGIAGMAEACHYDAPKGFRRFTGE